MRFDPEFQANKAYQKVESALRREGFQSFAVGGCVRDALLRMPCNDVDVATNARPHDLPKVFGTKPWDGDADVRESTDGVKLYPTGVSHGTWTVSYQGDHVEVTTYRHDVSTDGRRATVNFADSADEDAARRDFTMNALYWNKYVGLYDPTLEGLDDLLAGRVRFVGDADQRCQEDYLRILRLFRFHARFGRGPMDPAAWTAASKNRFGISAHVAKERVWEELKKLLSLHDPFDALLEMDATGVLQEVLNCRVPGVFGALFAVERQFNLKPNWVHRWNALTLDAPIPFPASNEERKRVDAASKAVEEALDAPLPLSALSHKFGPEAATHACLRSVRTYSSSDVDRGAMAQMPVSAQDFMDRGYQAGPRMGELLACSKKYWYSTDLRADKQALLKYATQEVPL